MPVAAGYARGTLGGFAGKSLAVPPGAPPCFQLPTATALVRSRARPALRLSSPPPPTRRASVKQHARRVKHEAPPISFAQPPPRLLRPAAAA